MACALVSAVYEHIDLTFDSDIFLHECTLTFKATLYIIFLSHLAFSPFELDLRDRRQFVIFIL